MIISLFPSCSPEGRLPETHQRAERDAAPAGEACNLAPGRRRGAARLATTGHLRGARRRPGRCPAKARPGAGDARLRVSQDVAVERRKAGALKRTARIT